jgi:small conductance mechanosensitive channel
VTTAVRTDGRVESRRARGAPQLDAIWDEIGSALENASDDLLGLAVVAMQVVLVVAVARLAAAWLRRRARQSEVLGRINPNITALALTGISIAVYLVAASFALDLLGASWSTLLPAIGISGLVIGLSLQDVLKNLVAGVYILLEQPFKIGDRIRVKDVEGRVEAIQIRTTAIRNDLEERVLIPNLTVFVEIVHNRSAAQVGQTVLTIEGVREPDEAFEREVRDALAGLPGLDGRPPAVVARRYAAEGATVEVRLWHAPGADVEAAALARLRQRLPDLTLSGGTE